MKKIHKTLALLFLCTIIISCSSDSKTAVAQLESKSGSTVFGTVTFTEQNGKVLLKAEIKGLTPGEHAIHIHEKGDCSSTDGKSAGGHWNPSNDPHGKWKHGEFHSGDIGNLITDANGNATLEKESDFWCIGCEDEQKNIIGHAIIVHASADDFTSQPSGAAGKRVACGEIQMK
ncbi:superoxide dismutase family protein [Polaribacter septentrionalilitoris]|uniref:superoxide dismutase family protein n=1 Tax=Polaribacter septentrionalilitoris TaxID=2494657 RepID=UPI001357133A|nr:superoxide dismutase family protein [Polaribacter septentrionalilitoris]